MKNCSFVVSPSVTAQTLLCIDTRVLPLRLVSYVSINSAYCLVSPHTSLSLKTPIHPDSGWQYPIHFNHKTNNKAHSLDHWWQKNLERERERNKKRAKRMDVTFLVLLLSFPRCWADFTVVLSLDLSEVSYKNAPDFLHVMYDEQKERENLIKPSFML